MINHTQSDLDRFWIKVDKSGSEEFPDCWLWTSQLRTGYGIFRLQGKIISAHRFSYFLATGENPGNERVRHSCDNGQCVNPDHLLLGTHADNMRDMYERERSQKTKLKNSEVAKMRVLAKEGYTLSEIAQKYKVANHLAYMAIRGETYKHVSESPFFDIVNSNPRELTLKDIVDIKRELKSQRHGIGNELAKRYGVSPAFISHIKTGRRHADIDETLEREWE